jgi:transposase InsO family protein
MGVMAGRDVPMSVRRLIVAVDTSTINVREFCAEHGVSTWFFWDLRRRHRAQGDAVLAPGSRAPHRVANRTPDAVIEVMVAVHKDLAGAGLDAGAESVWDHLPARLEAGQRCPSPATIYRHLRARGFTKVEPRKAPRGSTRRFAAERANERWQIDATGWALADGTAVEIIDVIDDCTRLLPGSLAVARCTAETALDAITRGAQRWGWPADVLSDNGAPFRGWPGDAAPGGLAGALAPLGITTSRCRPYHPQTCGKVERVHQTIKQHLRALPAADHLDELQAQLDTFIDYYNHQRRHRAIGRRAPADVFAVTPRSGPAAWPLDTATTIHRATVTGGSVWAGRYRISVGAAHDRQPATIIITGLNAHVFIHGRLARHLTLDPTRQHQPLRSTERDAPRQP